MADSILLETIHIVRTPGMLGGEPHIEGRRISVGQIAAHHNGGWPVEEISEAFDLTHAQIYAALSYYYDHKEEIDRAIQEEIEWFEQLKRERREFAGTDDDIAAFHALITPMYAAKLLGVTEQTVQDAIQSGQIEMLVDSVGSHLIRRADAEARWGKRKK